MDQLHPHKLNTKDIIEHRYTLSLIYYSLSAVNIYYDNTNVSAILFNSLHQGIMQKIQTTDSSDNDR